MRALGNLYLSGRFFIAWGLIMLFFCLSFGFDALLFPTSVALAAFILITLVDVFFTFRLTANVEATRSMSKMLSLGSQNRLDFQLVNGSAWPVWLTLRDEWPHPLQLRNHRIDLALKAGETRVQSMEIRPISRGEFRWGNLHVFVRSNLGLAECRRTFPIAETHAVVPSLLDMKKFELRNVQRVHQFQGMKKLRRLGHSYEFDQIRSYVSGDEMRSINWKATAKSSGLRVNQYTEEKSQQVYSVIDISRGMLMPFNGLSLLDYAVNASLVLSNVATGKEDKAGVITFSFQDEWMVKADRGPHQMRKILHGLYNVQEQALEADFERMYQRVRKSITQRSLLFLYTNALSRYALERNLPILRKLARRHVLVVVLFENSEISDFIQQEPKAVQDLYVQTMAEQLNADKLNFASIMRNYGIQVLVTRPEQLTVNSVNRYLELKAKGMI